MAAASEGIGIAKAAFFPAIHLTGAAGVESVELKDLFNWESRAWSFGPNLSLPLFEGGRNAAGLQRAKAAYEEAAAQYRAQVLIAFHEVEDGLIGLRLLKEQFEAQMRAVEGARKGADLSLIRYKEGLASYLEVVVADRTALENEILGIRFERAAHRDHHPVDQGPGRRLENRQRHEAERRRAAASSEIGGQIWAPPPERRFPNRLSPSSRRERPRMMSAGAISRFGNRRSARRAVAGPRCTRAKPDLSCGLGHGILAGKCR